MTRTLSSYLTSNISAFSSDYSYSCGYLICPLGWPYPDTVTMLIRNETDHVVGHCRLSFGVSKLPLTVSAAVTLINATYSDSDSDEGISEALSQHIKLYMLMNFVQQMYHVTLLPDY